MTLTAEEVKQRRAEIRAEVKRAHVRWQCATYADEPAITLEHCRKWSDELGELDVISPDTHGTAWYAKIRDIVNQLKRDAMPSPPEPKQEPQPTVNQIYYRNDSDAKIPPFDGQSCHYRQFERLFVAKYEHDQAYKAADRFLIFRNLVGEKGRDMIIDLEPDEDGLKEAKKRLRDYFDDPYKIREDVRKKVAKLARVTDRQQTNALKQLLVVCEESLKILSDCGSSSEFINETFFRQITSKLPFDLVERFNEANNRKQNVRQLLDWLKIRIENIACTNEMTGASSKVSETRVHAFAPHHQPSGQCLICTMPHRTIFCKSYESATRKEIAARLRLCFRFLETSHRSTECTSTYKCPCGGDHSLVICIKSGNRALSIAPTAADRIKQLQPQQQVNQAGVAPTQRANQQRQQPTNGQPKHGAVSIIKRPQQSSHQTIPKQVGFSSQQANVALICNQQELSNET